MYNVDEQRMWSLFLVIYFDDLFAKIHQYFSTVIGALMWAHTDKEVVLKDIGKKNSNTNQVETQQSANR